MNNNIIIALDNGHGTHEYMKGAKQSPDGSLYEGEYAREIVDLIILELTKLGIKSYKVTLEDSDVKLNTRVQRINKLYRENNKNVISISVHCNAAGSDGKWHDAKGWSVFVAQNASNNSKRLANCLAEAANDLKVRKPLPTQSYWVQSLAMCRDTSCPAVLTENLFQDNKEDVAYLLSDEGKKKIVDIHVQGILKYING